MLVKYEFVPASLATFLLGLAPAAALAQQSTDELSPELTGSLREAVVESTYRVTQGGGSCAWEAPNPAQEMQSTFTAEGIRVAGKDWSLDLSLETWGREGSLRPLEAAEPEVEGRRVEYRRGPVTEWYMNEERGLEQGFTVDTPPEGPQGDGPLCLVVSIGGGLSAEVLPSGREALFTDSEGGPVLHYTGLRAWDDTERELEASLALEDGRLSIRVEDERAVYPVHIDPCIQTEEAKLIASDPAGSDNFGYSLAVSGDTAVVGAYRDDHAGGTNAGSAYVFVQSGTTWSEQQKLTASDAATFDFFGASVAVSGDTAVVGADNDDLGAGSAYVFVRSGTSWTEEAKLTASDAAANDIFGQSVAVSGDTAVVGAFRDDHAGGIDAGSAYVFVQSGTSWSEQQKLTASDAAADDLFGGFVALSGDTAVVSALTDDHAGGTDAGSAYVFVQSGTSWSEQQKLTASDAAASDQFGSSVALLGDTAVVGADADDHAGGTNAGSAYVFVQSGTSWSEQQKLTASDAAASDFFGWSVAVSDDTTVVGAYADDHAGGFAAGSAYVFVQSGTSWSEQQKLTASDAADSDFFGVSVAVSGDTAVVGASDDDHAGGTNAGSAYVFGLSPWVTYCTAGTSASGCQASLSACGIASASAPSGFDLMAASVEGQKDGLFFFGANGRQANPWGNGTSSQCVVPPVKRAGLLTGTGTIGLCDGSFSQDLNAFWCLTCPYPAKNPGAAAVVQAQLWYRDPLNTSNQTTSMSDAIEFTVGP